MLARDKENSAAYAACTTDECRLAHAAALQSGNFALRNTENAYLSIMGLGREIEYLQLRDALRTPEQLKGLATVVGYAQANCGGVWSDACHASWNDNQSRLDQNARLLVAAIYAPAAVAGGAGAATALRTCLGNPVCINELAIGGMEAVAGDALGGATLATGGTAVATQGGRTVVNALDSQAASLSDDAIREALALAGGANSSTGAESAINQVRLSSQLLAEEIASGHAFQKHVVERLEFADLGINTKSQFQSFIEKIVSNPAIERRQAVDGTVYYLDSSTKTIVIRGQRGEATAFRPDKGGVGWENYIKSQVPKK